MSTALFDLATSIPLRIAELDRLTDHAKECELNNEALYNAICRASSVLMASHLKGFIKELTTSIIADLSYNLGEFAKMPKSMKRAFCERIAFYEGVPLLEINERIAQLVVFFEKNSVKIDMQAITYKENPNKNTSVGFIDRTFERIGVPNIMGAIGGGILDNVFDNDRSINYSIMRDLVRFRSLLFKFPHKQLPTRYQFQFRKRKPGDQSLWHSYVEDVLVRRHKVAHGDTMENETTWESLKSDIVKLQVMMHALMYASATFLCKSDER